MARLREDSWISGLHHRGRSLRLLLLGGAAQEAALAIAAKPVMKRPNSRSAGTRSCRGRSQLSRGRLPAGPGWSRHGRVGDAGPAARPR